MYAAIAATINRSLAPTGRNAGQWADSESCFVFDQPDQAFVPKRSREEAACYWYTCSSSTAGDLLACV